MTNENTKGKHTPGPWEIDEDGGGWWIYGGNDPRPTTGVAKCDGWVRSLGNICKQQNIAGQDLSNQELSANARLISAAPDLLSALRDIAETAVLCDSWESFPEEPIERAFAAIVKATGGDS